MTLPLSIIDPCPDCLQDSVTNEGLRAYDKGAKRRLYCPVCGWTEKKEGQP